MRSCHSGRGSRGTWRASPGCARRPSGVACASSCPPGSLFPRRFFGCAAYNRASLRLVAPSGCRSPLPGTGSAVLAQSVRDVPPQRLRWWLPAAWCHARSRRRSRPPAARHLPRRLCCASSPVCPDPWDSGPFFSPKARFGQRAVGRLPLPAQAAEFVALAHQLGPDTLHHPLLVPALKPTMHRAVVAKLLGQLVPLAPRPHAEDDAVQAPPPFGVLATGRLRRPVFLQDGGDSLPQR